MLPVGHPPLDDPAVRACVGIFYYGIGHSQDFEESGRRLIMDVDTAVILDVMNVRYEKSANKHSISAIRMPVRSSNRS